MKKLLSSFDKMRIFRQGTQSFLLFLAIILASKLVSNLFIGISTINIELQDFITASLGFLLVVIIKIIERFSHTQNS